MNFEEIFKKTKYVIMPMRYYEKIIPIPNDQFEQLMKRKKE